MTMMEAVEHVFKNYANFSGRARRSEYWYFVLFNFLVWLVFAVLGHMTLTRTVGPGVESVINIFRIIYALGVVTPGLAVGWRRMHDTGRPGWFSLAPLIISVMAIFTILSSPDSDVASVGMAVLSLVQIGLALAVFVCLSTNGDRGENKYGPDPKAEAAPEASKAPEAESAPEEKAPWEY